MKQDDIIKLARETGFDMSNLPSIRVYNVYGEVNDELARFAEIVAAAEREECAKACDSMKETAETLMEHPDYSHSAEYERMCAFEDAAERIRSRSATSASSKT